MLAGDVREPARAPELSDFTPQTPSRVHHFGFTTADPEKTRAFYEGLLDIPLVLFMCEREPSHLDGADIVMGHSFYSLPDGTKLAFLHHPDPAVRATMAPPTLPLTVHLSLKVSNTVQDEAVRRLRDAGHKVMVLDHGVFKSAYFADPDGLHIEYTVDPDYVTDIYSDENKRAAHDNLRRYLAGDHTPNNRWYPDDHQHWT